jgi:NADH-quinone oxidoreductase subunit J
MVQVAFFAGAIGAIGAAIAVIALRNPFYSVLALVVHLVSLAGLFLLLYAQFVAAAQVVVYAGAVMVLYVFVAAYVGAVEEPIWEPIPGQRFLAPLLAVALLVELTIAILGTGLTALDNEGPKVPAGFGTPSQIGQLLLERFLIVFEAASLLLLVAAVGAVVLAGRTRSNHSDGSSHSAPGPSGSGARVAAGTSGSTATSSLAPTDPPTAPGVG